MKRLNPDTGKPFVRGDTRADGFLFLEYRYTIKSNGFFQEAWASPDAFNRKRVLNNARSPEQGKKWRAGNKEKYLAGLKSYKSRNKSTVNSSSAKRRASKLQRTPVWLTENQLQEIKAIYESAYMLSIKTGIPHHVDHIVPLQGAHVSGLHVPWNLQILTASENCSKGNRPLSI